MNSVLLFKGHIDAQLPVRGSEQAAGWDVHTIDNYSIGNHVVRVDTGLEVAFIPVGYEIQFRPRSGLSSKGLLIANSPGTVDSDYRGRLMVLMYYNKVGLFDIKKGERVAQLVFAKVEPVQYGFVDFKTNTARGAGGFGSTGS